MFWMKGTKRKTSNPLDGRSQFQKQRWQVESWVRWGKQSTAGIGWKSSFERTDLIVCTSSTVWTIRIVRGLSQTACGWWGETGVGVTWATVWKHLDNAIIWHSPGQPLNGSRLLRWQEKRLGKRAESSTLLQGLLEKVTNALPFYLLTLPPTVGKRRKSCKTPQKSLSESNCKVTSKPGIAPWLWMGRFTLRPFTHSDNFFSPLLSLPWQLMEVLFFLFHSFSHCLFF